MESKRALVQFSKTNLICGRGTREIFWFGSMQISQDSFYKSPFASKCSCKKRSSHHGKKEVACIVSNHLVSCLWECGESVNPPKLNIQEVQGALSLKPKGDSVPAIHFSGFFTYVKSHRENISQN